MEVRVFGQQLELFIKHAQALFRYVVLHDVVDGDLHVLQAGVVQLLDAVFREQEAVGDGSGDGAGFADAADQEFQMVAHQGFAAAEGDDGGAEFAETVDTPVHLFDRDRFGKIVVLVAICTGKIAAAGGDDVRENRVVSIENAAGKHTPFAGAAVRGSQTSGQTCTECRHRG